MIQIDASSFEWFGGNEKFQIHGAIDDATGKIVGLYMAKHECLQGYFTIAKQFLLDYGIEKPVELSPSHGWGSIQGIGASTALSKR